MLKPIWISLGAIGAVGLLAIACEESVYVYSAQRYDAVAGCLDPYRSIELVSGSEVSSKCPVTCVVVAKETYVTTLCGPLPANASPLEADAASCVAATALATSDAPLCNADEEDDEESEGGEPEDAEAAVELDAAMEAEPSDGNSEN